MRIQIKTYAYLAILLATNVPDRILTIVRTVQILTALLALAVNAVFAPQIALSAKYANPTPPTVTLAM